MDKPHILYKSILIIFLCFLALLGFSFYLIFDGVRGISEKAKAEFGSDHTVALILLMESERHSFKERNRAVWALGQIGDKRALPNLLKLNNKVPSQTKPWDSSKYYVKYSIEKAIHQINSKFIVTRWMYSFL